jgi:hypothetical protein
VIDLELVDTLDLQDHHSPSAKDHSKQAVHTKEGSGLAPHQELEVRHADHDSKAEMMHGPNAHGAHLETDGYHDGIDIYDDTDDIHVGLGVHRGASDIRGRAEDDDLSDGEGDDLLDDDLLDKISSSPSIDDGRFCAPLFFEMRITWGLPPLSSISIEVILTDQT